MKRARHTTQTKGRRIHQHPLTRAIVISLMLATTCANAALPTSVWHGQVSTDWNDPANWNSFPTDSSKVLIDYTDINQAELTGNAATIQMLTVGFQGDGVLRIDQGGSLHVTEGQLQTSGQFAGVLIAEYANDSGSIIVSGENSNLTVDAATQIGNGGEASLSILQGASASLGLTRPLSETVIGLGYYGYGGNGVADGRGTVLVDGAGSTLDYAGGMSLLNGSLTVSNGGQLVGHTGQNDGTYFIDVIGYGLPADAQIDFPQLDGQGTATITGSGSAWRSVNGLSVGYGGSGTLSVLDGAAASFQGQVNLGDNAILYAGDQDTGLRATGTGVIHVSGAGSTFTVAQPAASAGLRGDLNVGYYGDGSMTVDTGAAVDVVGRLRVGTMTHGSLDIASGGTVAVHGSDARADGLVLGDLVNSDGMVSVSGAGSTLSVDHGAQIGAMGSGSLSISNGGSVNLGLTEPLVETTVGFANDGNEVGDEQGIGKIKLDGANSTLNYAGGFHLLNGSLDISHGGQLLGHVRSGDGDTGWVDTLGYAIPADADGNKPALDGTGTVSISGAGSSWLSVNALTIGQGGTGLLSVLDGAAASFRGAVALGTAASRYGTDPDSGQSVVIGSSSGTGHLTVSGQDSTLTVTAAPAAGGLGNGDLIVGNGAHAAGYLHVDGGGVVNVSGNLLAGGGDSAQNQRSAVVVAGNGSALNVTGERIELDTASLSVRDGAHIAANDLLATSASNIDIYGGGTITATTFHDEGSHLMLSGDDSTLTADSWIFNGAGSVIVADGARVAAQNPVALQGSLVIGGVNANNYLPGPGSVDFPQLTFNTPDATLVFDHSGDDYTFAADMHSGDYESANAESGLGEGHIQVRNGFTRLTGDSHTFIGTTMVDDGATLSVNGRLGGEVSVAPGGRLQGTGYIDDAVIGGTLAPGNSPGTLHVNGDLVLQTGSVYEAQIDPASNISDRVDVAGNVTIEPGTTLHVQSLGNQPLTPGDHIQLIRSTGGGTVDGRFGHIEGAAASLFMGYGVTYTANGIDLGITRSDVSFASVGDTAQSKAVGAALDRLPPGSALATVLYTQLTNADQAKAAFRPLAGSLHADLRRIMLDDSRMPRDTLQRRLQDSTSSGSHGPAWWVRAMGDWGRTDANGDVAGARTDSSGAMIGVDTGLGDTTRLGVAAGLSQTSYRAHNQASSAHLKSRHLAVYGRSSLGAFDIGYGAAFSWHDIGTHRRFDIGSAPQQLNSDHHARTDQLFLDAGYRLGDNPRHATEPFVTVAHVRVHDDGAHEHGSSAALDVDQGNENATFSTLGLRWTANTTTLQWYGSIGWRHVFGPDRTHVRATFTEGDSPFAISSLPMAANAAHIELGARLQVSRHAYISAGYNGLISSSSHEHGARLQWTLAL